MKTGLGKVLKTVMGLIAAAVILDIFCAWYYNPLAYLWEESRATDTVRQPNAFTSRATEGIAWTTTDNNGYNNASVPEDGIFVLAMGSSHMEGFNVMQDEMISSRLEALLAEGGIDGSVYNIGMSSHTLARNIANLDRALERFKPSGYVILETHDIAVTRREFKKAMSDSFGRRMATKVPLPDFLSERPLLRALYNQYMTFMGDTETPSGGEVLMEYVIEEYRASMLQMMQHVGDTARRHGVTPILLYHPHLSLNADGSAQPQTDLNCLKAFKDACRESGVVFVDLTEDFEEQFQENYVLPHGFSNTVPGTGHLNREGHRMAAEALCEEILRMEAEK